MKTRTYESPTDSGYFVNHPLSSLQGIVDRYTAQSAAMAATAPSLATEAMTIANNAWAEIVERQSLLTVPESDRS